MYAGDPASSAPSTTQLGGTQDSNVTCSSTRDYWNEGGADYTRRRHAVRDEGGRREDDRDGPAAGLPGRGLFRRSTRTRGVESCSADSMGGGCRSECPTSIRTSARDVFIDEATGSGARQSTTARATATSNGLTVWDNSSAPSRAGRPRRGSACGSRSAAATSTDLRRAACRVLRRGRLRTGCCTSRGWSMAGQRRAAEPAARAQRHALRRLVRRPVLLTTTSALHDRRQRRWSTSGRRSGRRARRQAHGGDRRRARYPLTSDAATGRWVSTGDEPRSRSTPGRPGCRSSCDWEETKGTGDDRQQAESCKLNGNKCVGTFGSSTRTLRRSEARSGADQARAALGRAARPGANSFELRPADTRNLVVRIARQGEPQTTRRRERPARRTARHGGSQNQSLDCDPDFRTCGTRSLRVRPEVREQHGQHLSGDRLGAVGDRPALELRGVQTGEPTARWSRG